ncbi:LacI family DNA-binding transcriptional regulator [Actinacidiphila paucisporea]|uniref:LacI family DNA-binding transcriptional regulator n=1 Tax=Actinacidiphila paucisporea TaxID=310782 RepID=UPI002244F591|nr:LacI family DNA-binding transcriptional regulator [Actinacidiphila paucisporea]
MSRIADLAGVSASTVSKVIHGRTGVSVGTRQRIEELIREHGRGRTWPRSPRSTRDRGRPAAPPPEAPPPEARRPAAPPGGRPAQPARPACTSTPSGAPDSSRP